MWFLPSLIHRTPAPVCVSHSLHQSAPSLTCHMAAAVLWRLETEIYWNAAASTITLTIHHSLVTAITVTIRVEDSISTGRDAFSSQMARIRQKEKGKGFIYLSELNWVVFQITECCVWIGKCKDSLFNFERTLLASFLMSVISSSSSAFVSA